ncbi:acyl-CoA dehydrogenase NM domain-like protein [Hyaloscypha variabilis F]|uniref:Acyl-CoA dehydrogenase NM domain-like protein n=1 Tax=Hyaloscypha variabilis (strain UAMH 11265 / GT02V1 / F) TaxID=1149755 RepID=A0A2J6R502_HYAVF|nr:acyl-CoA dehydrogenase NM domain-like protein [Hyaloscypha variabilis F]
MATSSETTPFAEPLWHTRPTGVYYKDSHRQLRDSIHTYISEKIAPNCAEWEEQGFVPKEVLLEHSLRGYTAVTVNPAAIAPYLRGNGEWSSVTLPGGIQPEEWDAFHDLVCIDEIARCGYLGVIWALGCGDAIGLPPVINFGTEEQKRRFLPGVLRGQERFCLGVTEPDAGSDVANITTTAERRGNVYIVNGAKKWITNGMWATYCTAAVRTGGPGKGGISALVIPLTSKGVTRRKILNSGVAASGSTYIEFDDVEVPVSNLLGTKNQGFKIIMSNFNHERVWLACTSLRLARTCLQDAYNYALSRQTFGTALINHQAIRSKFSVLGGSILPAHAFMESLVAHSLSNSDPQIGGLIALLKVMAGKALEQAAREAQQIMGGLGYSRTGKGARIEQIGRDVRVLVVGGGSEEILSDLAFRQEKRDLVSITRNTKSKL